MTVRAHTWVDDPVSGGVDVHVGLLSFVHVCEPLEENVPNLF